MKYLLLRNITCLDIPQRNGAQYNPRWLLVFFTRWDAYCFPHTYFFSNTRSNLLDISQACWGGKATFIMKNNLYSAKVDGCSVGVIDEKTGEPLLKKWRFLCSSERQAASLSDLRCKHPKDFVHGEISGSKTKKTE